MFLTSSDSKLSPLLRRLLLVDAAFEFVVAAMLSGVLGRPHFWLNVDRSVVLTGAALLAVVGVILAVSAFHRAATNGFVQNVAFANLVSGAAIWAAAALNWSQFEPGGHWLVAFIADGCIVLGALQLLALRKPAA